MTNYVKCLFGSVLGFVTLAGLSSCSNLNTTQSKTFNSDKKISVGLNIYREDDLFIKGMADAYQVEADKYDNVELNVLAARNKQDVQYKQIDGMIAKDKALLVNMVDVSQSATVGANLATKAKDAGLPIVFFNRDPGSKVLEGYKKAFYVGSIPAQSGLLQGELIIADWLANPKWDLNHDGKLQYIILKGEEGHADAEGRTKWAQATIQNYPDKGITSEKLTTISANWQKDEAKEKLASWLDANPDARPEIIIANNDGMALGAIELLEERKKLLPVYGVDAVPDALKLIKSGRMAGTILQDTKGQVQESLKLSINLANDRDIKQGLKYKVIGKRVMVPYVAINKKNVDDFI